MKRIKLLLCLFLALCLVACSDASAKVSNANEALITIGSKKVTKGAVYEYMLTQDNCETILRSIKNQILDAEVEVTSAMETAAKDELAETKELYGDVINDYLNYLGYSDEDDYYENYCLANQKTSALLDNYINDNWDAVILATYPTQVKMMVADSQEDAANAFKEIEKGTSFEKVIEKYSTDEEVEEFYDGKVHVVSSSDESTLPSGILDFIKENNVAGTREVIENSSSNKYYVVELVSKDALSFKRDALDSIKKSTSFETEAMAYYYKEHNFHTYDVTLRDYLKEYYPTYLNQ